MASRRSSIEPRCRSLSARSWAALILPSRARICAGSNSSSDSRNAFVIRKRLAPDELAVAFDMSESLLEAPPDSAPEEGAAR
eukprot:559161-Prymnesium_polylepis.1